MRIVVHGQQAFGKAVLEALLKRGDEVVAVYVAPEKEGAKADPLKEAALAAKLPVYQPVSYRKPEVWAEFQARSSRTFRSWHSSRLFVPEEFLNMPTKGSIQYHPSLLPKYRGPSAINWPIIKGDTETGLSIFWPDNGLDTGDVLLQKKTPISDTDSLGSVYFDRLFPMGVEAMLEAVDLVKAGKAPRIKQDHAQATYEGRCGPDNARIDWGKPWRQIHNLIRGCNPAPGAWTTLNGQALQIFESQPLPAQRPQGHRRQDGRDRRGRLPMASPWCAPTAASRSCACKPADGPKCAAGEFATNAKLNLGTRLCMNSDSSDRSQGNRSPPRSTLNPKSDIEIAQSAKKRLIMDVARDKLGIAPEHLEPYGHYKAKVSMDFIKSLKSRPNGKLILVSAITPTPAGEGKTTTTVGLTDALNHIGKKAMLCLREPSLGPSFGMKGGAAGGGYAQVVPMEDINLHFTGDFHAITSAHNLLAAHDRQPHLLGQCARHRPAPRRLAARDGHERPRAALDRLVARRRRQRVPARGRLRHHGGVGGRWRSSASPATSTISRSASSNIIVAYTRDRKPVRAGDLKAHGADDRAAQGGARRPIWCRRWKARRPSSTAGRSPTSRMAATRCWRPRPR